MPYNFYANDLGTYSIGTYLDDEVKPGPAFRLKKFWPLWESASRSSVSVLEPTTPEDLAVLLGRRGQHVEDVRRRYLSCRQRADLREHHALQHIQPPGLGHRFPILRGQPLAGHGLEGSGAFARSSRASAGVKLSPLRRAVASSSVSPWGAVA